VRAAQRHALLMITDSLLDAFAGAACVSAIFILCFIFTFSMLYDYFMLMLLVYAAVFAMIIS